MSVIHAYQLKTRIMGVIIIFIMLFFGFRECQNRKNTDDLIADIANYKDSAQFYLLKLNGQEVEISYNKSLALENKEQLEALVKKNDTLAKLVSKFKDIKSTTIINNNTTIVGDTIKIKGDSIPCDFKPFHVRRDSAYYNFLGTIAKNYFTIDSLTIPNKQSIVIGEKKLGLFKGKELRAEIINSNPLVKVTNIESYVVSKPKKFYQTQAFAFGVGILGGGYLTYKLIK